MHWGLTLVSMIDTVGLIPAAGRGRRLGPLPFSKEIYPIGFPRANTKKGPRAVCQYLLEQMRFADIKKAYVILRNGKWDIPGYLQDGKLVNMDLAYIITSLSYGPPYTLNQAYPFVKEAIVAFGFPDILTEPKNVFAQLLDDFKSKSCDVLLGLFPADDHTKVDMVQIDNQGRLERIINRPDRTDLSLTWAIAVWGPGFTQFLNKYVTDSVATAEIQPEPSVGQVIQAAVDEHLSIRATVVSQEPYLDIGTPDGLRKATVKHSRYQAWS